MKGVDASTDIEKTVYKATKNVVCVEDAQKAIEILQQEIEQLQIQTTKMKEAFLQVQHDIDGADIVTGKQIGRAHV